MFGPPHDAHESGSFVKELPETITFIGKPQIGLPQLFCEQVPNSNVIADDEHAAHFTGFVDRAVAVRPPNIFTPAVAGHRHELVFVPSCSIAGHHEFNLRADDIPDFLPAITAVLPQCTWVAFRAHS